MQMQMNAEKMQFEVLACGDRSMYLFVDAADHGRCDAEAERGVMFAEQKQFCKQCDRTAM